MGLALLVGGAAFVTPAHASPTQDTRSRDSVSVYSTEGERVLVRNEVRRRADGAEWRLVEESRLGRVDGSGPDIFSDIRDIAVDGGRRVYVLDVGWKEVRVFSRDGRYLRSMAREGDGPGEMRHRNRQSRIVWQPPNRLWVGNGHQQLTLDTLGNELGRYSREITIPLPPARPELEPVRMVIGADTLGSVYQRIGGWGPPGGPVTVAYNRVARLQPFPEAEASREKTLLVEVSPMITGETTTARRARGTLNLTHARPRPWRIAMGPGPGGTVWLAHRSAYRFHEVTFDGDTIRTVALGNPPPAPAEETDFEGVLASIDVSADGWLWAKREPAEGDSDEATTWDLFDNCGRYRGPVTIPARTGALNIGAGGKVHAVLLGPLDIHFVARLRLESRSGAHVASQVCPF